ncbi:Putative ribonuclease H protein At1g65750 [Linum perenne]
MMNGARAGVRDGKLTSFWFSRWLDSGITLTDWANESDIDFNPSDCVADFIEGDEGWNIDKLNRLLPSELVEQVVGRSPAREELGPDNWIWGDSHDGRFSNSSAYNLITEQSAQQTNGNIMKVWKWVGPNRVKCFLWLAFHERLITNAKRARCHLTTSLVCSRCGDQ